MAELLEHELGLGSEVVLSPQDGLVTQARPDFVFWLDEGRGITTARMWKAHISPDTQHLFLVVPQANWGVGGRAREKPFPRVAYRLAAFFGDARRELDVVSAHIFGYGQLDGPVTDVDPEI